MCTLRDFCCCCSLSTGVFFISVVNMLLSFFPYLYHADSLLIVESSFRLEGYSVQDLSCIYYGITAAVSVAAFLSVLSSSRWLLLPLQLWDWIRLSLTLEIVCRSFGKRQANSWIIVAVILVYCISVEYSYHKELMQANQLDGMILRPATTVTVCTATVPSAPPVVTAEHQFAPASTVVPLPEEYSVQSPYAKSYLGYQPQPQSPYPASAPAAPMYPAQQPYAAGAAASPASFANATHTYLPAPGAPPPYPAPQSQTGGENPPPYAP